MSKNFNDQLNDLTDSLDSFQKKLEKNSGTQEVTFDVLFPNSFMTKHSKYSDIDSFLSASNINSQEDFDNVPESQFDVFVNANSDFSSWQNMQQQATNEYFAKKLGFSN